LSRPRINGNKKNSGKPKKRRRKERVHSKNDKKLILAENLRKGSRGMASFYQKMMEEEELKHEAAVRAAATAPQNRVKKEDVEAEITREKRLADEARRINAELGTEAVAVNDEGEVVDKRQLLKGGLNVFAPKQAPQVAHSEYQEHYEARRASEKQKIRERESQVRQKRAVEEQYESVKKRAADEEAEREEEIRLRAKSKKTGDEVMGARERYLARKKAAAAGK
jgi:coiled-coil domain-containing protein 55